MNTYPFIIIITAFLVLLWAYASLSKLFNLPEFKQAMSVQVFPLWIGKILTVFLPVIELVIVALLIMPSTRLLGMHCSFFLMGLFTLYVAGAVLKIYERTPCACGGLFARLNWQTHLRLNLILTLIALTGILLLS